MEHEATSVNSFDDWYTHREVVDFGTRMGCLDFKGLTSLASGYLGNYTRFKREMDVRCTGFEKLEMLADNEVISPKDDLPNVSSGETAGIVRRMARNLVQHTPNVEIVNKYDDDSPNGVFAVSFRICKAKTFCRSSRMAGFFVDFHERGRVYFKSSLSKAPYQQEHEEARKWESRPMEARRRRKPASK